MTQMENAGAQVNVRTPTGFFTNLQVKDWATLIIIAPSGVPFRRVERKCYESIAFVTVLRINRMEN
jgi:filamentous hemagglutinin family protein